MTLLDIGGGVGGIQHTLLDRGVVHATHIDASSAYVQAAKEEAVRRKMDEKIVILYGDFVELAENIPNADIVTLDRVICCYDNMQCLVKLSAKKANKTLGLVYPRDLLLFRLLIPVANLFLKLVGTPFRIFLHPTKKIDRIIRDEGLASNYSRTIGFWQIHVYNRA